MYGWVNDLVPAYAVAFAVAFLLSTVCVCYGTQFRYQGVYVLLPMAATVFLVSVQGSEFDEVMIAYRKAQGLNTSHLPQMPTSTILLIGLAAIFSTVCSVVLWRWRIHPFVVSIVAASVPIIIACDLWNVMYHVRAVSTERWLLAMFCLEVLAVVTVVAGTYVLLRVYRREAAAKLQTAPASVGDAEDTRV
jgi:hypothetical protein